MKKSFFIHCTGFTPKQAGAFSDVIQDFFDEMMCGGRSHASCGWIDIEKGMEVILQKKKKALSSLPTL